MEIAEIPVWEVNLIVYGSITVESTIRFSEFKGLRLLDPFYSDIEIRRNRFDSGVVATVTAFAPSGQLAREAAILFFGQTLDVLSLQINQPLYLNFNDNRSGSNASHNRNNHASHNTLRRVKKEEWQDAFKEARLLASTETTFLRALSWYRKGLHSEDPFDKFLAFWNAIEIVASKYHPPIPKGREKASKSQTWESFKALWGECENWSIIQGQKQWIDENYEIRMTIAHGIQPIDIETVKEVTQKLDAIQQVAHKFLWDWRHQELNPQIPPHLRDMMEY